MSGRRASLRRCQGGIAAVEFAIAAPLLILLLVGILQLGLLGLAKAGLGHAVEAGARYATIYPRPTDEQISAKVRNSGFGMADEGIAGPSLEHGLEAGLPYLVITMSYSQMLDFGFFSIGPVRITHTRRAYLAQAPGGTH